MNFESWAVYVLLGAFLGTCGQVARAAVGLKKLHDANSLQPDGAAKGIDVTRLIVSLLFGATAGILAALGLWSADMATRHLDRDFIVAIIVAGYAGADFIEGFVRRSGIDKPAVS